MRALRARAPVLRCGVAEVLVGAGAGGVIAALAGAAAVWRERERRAL